MSVQEKGNLHARMRWSALACVLLVSAAVAILVPKSPIGKFASVGFCVVLMCPICIGAFQVLVRRRSLRDWPLLAIVTASGWYVWFAYLSMTTDPSDIEISLAALWIASGIATAPVMCWFAISVSRNRLALILSLPLVICMSAGVLRFVVEVVQFML